MARVAGVDIPNNKRLEIALTYIYGVGPHVVQKVLTTAGVDGNIRVKDLSEGEVASLQKAIISLEIPVEGELKRMVSQHIKRLQDIKSYRGSRHRAGLPVRGQSTRRNARTRKGKKRAVGGTKKKLTKK